MDIQQIIIPPTSPHTHTVVFLHGRGDTAPAFASSLPRDSQNRSLAEIFPSFRWVFPQAETRQCTTFPHTRIPQWFDIWNVSDFSQHEELQATGLRESVMGIHNILANEAMTLNGKWDHIILAGISQGAATSVHTLLNLKIPSTRDKGAGNQQVPRRLGAFIGFSCRMPFSGRSLAETKRILNLQDNVDDNEIIRNTPVLLEHCVDDPLVLVGLGRSLRDTLQGFGAQVTWKEYPSGGHWFNSPQGVHDVTDFLNSHIRDTPGSGFNNLPTEDLDSMDLS